MAVKLGKTESVPKGELVRFTPVETEVLVINRDGVFFGLAARCTHAGAPLEEGTVTGDVLVCPWHGSNFRISDGAVLTGPAERPLRSFRVLVRDGYLFVEI